MKPPGLYAKISGTLQGTSDVVQLVAGVSDDDDDYSSDDEDECIEDEDDFYDETAFEDGYGKEDEVEDEEETGEEAEDEVRCISARIISVVVFDFLG